MKARSRTDPVKLAYYSLIVSGFVAMNVGYVLFVPLRLSLLGAAHAWLLVFAAAVLSHQLAELVLALLLPEAPPPRLTHLRTHPPVALVCCTCDDANARVLATHRWQSYRNLEIFVLDDSRHAASRDIVDGSGHHVVRRRNREGFKAGNLNHWLKLHGQRFEHVVVADADSYLPPTFVAEMVAHAEHPENAHVAIFDSVIRPWNTGSPFARSQAMTTPLARAGLLRVDNRLGSAFSVGHNNLIRVRALEQVGGFTENYLAEDFATSVELVRTGRWTCKTTSVVSHERVPSNLGEFARRQARWAAQSFQLCSLPTSGLSWRERAKLLQVLATYSVPLIAPVGVLLLILFNVGWRLTGAASFSAAEMLDLLVESRLPHFWLTCLLAPAIARGALAVRQGVALRHHLWVTFFQAGLFACTLWPVIRAVSEVMRGRRIGFTVTGRSERNTPGEFLRLAGPGWALMGVAVASICLNPVLASLNLLWALPGALAPLAVFSLQADAS